ncbi:hypothetical protein MMC14_008051 [Varicellaria rhodocarpa]|nr:hypothetical protein [Varicellaria rhodocarpa]
MSKLYSIAISQPSSNYIGDPKRPGPNRNRKPLTKIVLPIPEPKDNELLIKVTVAGLNPLDYNFRYRNAFDIASRLPAILSGDIAGIVVMNGPNSTSFPPGTHVFSQANSRSSIQGGLQDYTLVDSRYTTIVPPNLTDDDAAIFPINATTSALSLFGSAGLNFPFPGTPESLRFDYPSQKLIIIGGGTNCGKLTL